MGSLNLGRKFSILKRNLQGKVKNSMDQKKIQRINELAYKAKHQGLTELELAEQQRLRQEYLYLVRQNFERTLQQVVWVDEKGNQIPAKKRPPTQKN